jgi:hypothetical protein
VSAEGSPGGVRAQSYAATIVSNIHMDVANLLALEKNRVQLMLVWMWHVALGD